MQTSVRPDCLVPGPCWHTARQTQQGSCSSRSSCRLAVQSRSPNLWCHAAARAPACIACVCTQAQGRLACQALSCKVACRPGQLLLCGPHRGRAGQPRERQRDGAGHIRFARAPQDQVGAGVCSHSHFCRHCWALLCSRWTAGPALAFAVALRCQASRSWLQRMLVHRCSAAKSAAAARAVPAPAPALLGMRVSSQEPGGLQEHACAGCTLSWQLAATQTATARTRWARCAAAPRTARGSPPWTSGKTCAQPRCPFFELRHHAMHSLSSGRARNSLRRGTCAGQGLAAPLHSEAARSLRHTCARPAQGLCRLHWPDAAAAAHIVKGCLPARQAHIGRAPTSPKWLAPGAQGHGAGSQAGLHQPGQQRRPGGRVHPPGARLWVSRLPRWRRVCSALCRSHTGLRGSRSSGAEPAHRDASVRASHPPLQGSGARLPKQRAPPPMSARRGVRQVLSLRVRGGRACAQRLLGQQRDCV